MKTGTLYVVATPIGNLEDITLRALRILKTVFTIAAEDTRRTKKLSTYYDINVPLTSYHENNEREKGSVLISYLKEGHDIAIVSDAGTPGISDPGYRLVRSAVKNSISVVTIPGPSAAIAVLSIAGLPTDSFLFEGFAPSRNSQRKRFIVGIKGIEKTVILYESPKRLKKLLHDIAEILGDVDLVIAREVTKLHEEILRGKVKVIIGTLEDRTIKGEVTVAIGPQKPLLKKDISITKEIEAYLKLGIPLKEVVKLVANEVGRPKREIYKEAISMKKLNRAEGELS